MQHSNCDLDTCQDCRIKFNMKEIDWETWSFTDIEDIFEDADPMKYL